MDTDIYRKFDKYCLLLQSYLSIAAILLLTFGIDAILFSSSALAEPPVYYLNSDQLNDHSLNWSTSDYWSNADGSSPSNIPDNVNGCIFAVGDDYMLRTPEVDTPQTFPYNESGEYNKLYLGYNHNASAFDTGYLNLKCKSVRIDNLILGNGVIDQGLFNSHVTLQGAITVNGNATVMINDESSHEDRLLTIESSIAGSGTLNFTTAYKESRIGFHLASASNSFNGSVIIDNKSSISFEAEDVFVNAASITSGGDLTINANQTFNGPVNCTGGSFNFNVTPVELEDHTYVLKSGNLVLESGGTLNNLFYRVTSSRYTGEPYNIPKAVVEQFILDNGNITNNSSQDLILNNTTDTEYRGVITSVGKLIKKGSGTLKITSTAETSLNCAVDINEGTILLQNSISGKNRFGGTLNINSGGTLECEAQDSLGNGTAALTFNINGGTLLLNTSKNQTLMNKTVNLIGGVIKAGDAHPECQGIEIKSGTTINGHAATGASADNPTVSTISVPIKVRENELLKINVDENAQIIFTNLVYNESNNTIGIEKNGAGVLTFSHTETIAASKTFSKPITVNQGVLQLTHDAVVTHGTVTVNDNGTLEYFVEEDEIKNITIANANKIFSTGNIVKTGDGTLQILTAATGMISAESLVISSGRMDAKGYISGKLSVAADAMLSPGNSIGSLWIEDFIIGETTYSGELILNETGSKLLMEIGGSSIDENDSLVANGDLTLHDGSIVYLAATDDCDLQHGDTFTAVLSGSNSAALAADGFIGKYVRSIDFIDLQYIQLNGDQYGANNGKYAITGRRYIDPNAVPEPSTWALLILGAAGLMCLRYTKNIKDLGKSGDSRLA